MMCRQRSVTSFESGQTVYIVMLIIAAVFLCIAVAFPVYEYVSWKYWEHPSPVALTPIYSPKALATEAAALGSPGEALAPAASAAAPTETPSAAPAAPAAPATEPTAAPAPETPTPAPTPEATPAPPPAPEVGPT